MKVILEVPASDLHELAYTGINRILLYDEVILIMNIYFVSSNQFKQNEVKRMLNRKEPSELYWRFIMGSQHEQQHPDEREIRRRCTPQENVQRCVLMERCYGGRS